MDRLVLCHTLLPSLLFRSMKGSERLSALYCYHVELVSIDGEIDLKSLLAQSLSLQIKQPDSVDHWLNGIITSFSLKGKEGGSSRYYIYEAEVRPQLWYLTQHVDFRIWQDKSVVDIIGEVLARVAIKVENRLYAQYRHWQYCVQYNESDFDFISRLMEHEGIYYFFKHENGCQTLVLADTPEGHDAIASESIPYHGPAASAMMDKNCVNRWQVCDAVMPQFVSMNDYDFHKPYANLLEVKENYLSFANERTEIYEWPGHYTEKNHAEFYGRIRQQEKIAQHEKMTGSASTVMLTPGYHMNLLNAPRQQDNQKYLIIQSDYQLWDNTYASGDDASRGQKTEFVAIPADKLWRSPRVAPWPKTQGPQTARVVCPEGETIWTDSYGRVKVKFHWDRYAKGDDTSSCWIRVSSAWAGQGYGAIQIPRLNDEVVVDFINGDPDRPLIVGRVYNEANTVPWKLPESATQMGIYSRSKNGHSSMANIFRFEDANGAEEVFLQAQRDYNVEIRNDQSNNIGRDIETKIGQDQRVVIAQDEDIEIGRDRFLNIKQNQEINIGQDRLMEIGRDLKLKINNHYKTETMNQRSDITHADQHLEIKGHYQQKVEGSLQSIVGESVLIHTKQLTLNGTDRVIIQGPAGKITIDGSGVSIDAPSIKLNGPVAVATKALGQLAALKSAAQSGTPLVDVCADCNS